jgi:hypothetical protein
VAIAIDAMDERELGLVMAHEVGHFLGLLHTSERDGRVLESLPDTPECRQDTDANESGIITAEECSAGAGNLMFWQAQGTEISVAQAEVLRGAYLLY